MARGERTATHETRSVFGLCDTCRHQRIVRSGRGSVFSMCLLSKTDDAFPKYPRVPVTACTGHAPRS